MAGQTRKVAAPAAHHDCDFRDMLSRVGDKWSLLVIVMLEGMPRRRARFEVELGFSGISGLRD